MAPRTAASSSASNATQTNSSPPRLRALIEARVDLLPTGFRLGDEYEDIPQAERDWMLAAFLASKPGKRWAGDEHAEDVVATAIEFGAEYNYGGPLRWSPVVVEIFMTSWIARKVIRRPAFFERVPDVLVDWVAYAGSLRNVPPAALKEAIEAVAACRDEMLDAVSDPDAWGPAKAFAVAAHSVGVDLSDPAAATARIIDPGRGEGRAPARAALQHVLPPTAPPSR